MRRRIGIFGGTFDPVHVGHLVAAVSARHACELDEVLLVVANDPWQKSASRSVGPAETRLAAVEAAVAGHVGLKASRIEIDRGGPSYMVDTVVALAGPEVDLYLILGFDAASSLGTWHRWEEIAQVVNLVIVNRPGGPKPALSPQWRTQEVVIPNIEVSSTDLRARFEDGRPLEYLIPDKALVVLRSDRTYP